MGNWMKQGRGGSYEGYFKMRDSPKDYPITPQQKKVRDAGREVGKECKGKIGADFKECRSDIMTKHFG